MARRATPILVLSALLLAAGAAFLAAQAQSLPGLPAPQEPLGEPDWLQSLWIWLQVQQAALRRELVELLSQLKAGDSGALIGLVGGAFLYGVVHAAGPGHGKLIISSYLFANGSQVRSGLWLTAVSSLLQAVSAIALVGLLAFVLDRARLEVTRDVQLLEIVSYALIVLLGLVMLWRALLGGGHRHHNHAAQDHDHAHDHGHHAGHDHAHEADGHHHHGWTAPAAAIPRRDFWAMAFSIGIRPCSGAVIVLLFTLGQGLVLAGVGATLAMAVGTALTVAALALLAIGSRRLALSLAGEGSGAARILARSFGLLGALAVILLGILFLWVAWTEPPPL